MFYCIVKNQKISDGSSQLYFMLTQRFIAHMNRTVGVYCRQEVADVANVVRLGMND